MIRVTATADTAGATAFVVEISAALKDRRKLNAALGSRLADELQEHLRNRNREPNKMGAGKTNFWERLAALTSVAKVDAEGATVAVADTRLRIHLYGGVIKPTGGRKFLTIPLIKEARAKRVEDYENDTGKKLFRLPGTRVLVETSKSGDRSTVGDQKATMRSEGGKFSRGVIRGRSQVRAVYALATQVTIRKDPLALPPMEKLTEALVEEGNSYLARNP